MIASLVRADALLYRAERALAGLVLAAMGVVVFLDVLHRISTRQGSWLASPWFQVALGTLLVGLACGTRGDRQPWLRGAAAGLLLAGLRWLFLRVFPNGLVWSQTVALSVTLWLGMLGASLAAYERRHLALDVGSRLWPKSVLPYAAGTGHLVTAAFCLLIGWLGWRSVDAHWELWTSSEHAAGNLAGLPIPKWMPALSIPYGGLVLAFRFGLEGLRTMRGELAAGGDDTLHQLGIDQEPEGARP